ncbi:MAG: chorismate mutase [Proteobacteria bacterium]|nr:chorismate mutase [Pseudomonadota bacterium]MBI3499391.1 chorismate mutase [Pseudomonadota bacterium]
MTTAPPALDALRREIDEIDDAIHDLILRRAEIVREIGRVKTSVASPMLRPAREAQVLRRLARRHRGPVPMGVMVRLWRELITGGSLGLQENVLVAVYGGEDGVGCWDLARDHYGGSVPMRSCRSPGEVVDAVAAGTATVGVLPAPGPGEAAPWWPLLLSDRPNPPRVVVKLPFADRSRSRTAIATAFVVAAMAHEESGEDRTLVALAAKAGADEAGIATALERVELKGSVLAIAPDKENDTQWRLLELAGFVGADDRRLALLAREPGIGRALTIGGYATPLSGS